MTTPSTASAPSTTAPSTETPTASTVTKETVLVFVTSHASLRTLVKKAVGVFEVNYKSKGLDGGVALKRAANWLKPGWIERTGCDPGLGVRMSAISRMKAFLAKQAKAATDSEESPASKDATEAPAASQPEPNTDDLNAQVATGAATEAPQSVVPQAVIPADAADEDVPF